MEEQQLQLIQDRLDIMELIARYAAGLDARDWTLWRNVFLEETVFDLSSWTKAPGKKLNADRVAKAQGRMFAELETTQHFMTNHRITVDGDKGRVVAHMRAEHWGRVNGVLKRYTMFGYYDDKLARTADGWKIAEMQLNVTQTEGDRAVMDQATIRSRKKAKG